jgi:hypothetical protein
MKLLLENWRQYIAEEQRVEEGLMDRVKNKLQRMAGIEDVSGKINPYPEGEGYWMDIAVPYSKADVKNLSDDTLLAAAVIDKLAEEMGFKEPVVTSGYRDNHRQANAMYNNWIKANKEKEPGYQNYLATLYGTKCKSCTPNAGEIAIKVNQIFNDEPDSNKAIKAAGDLMSNSLISRHNEIPGEAIDYRFRGHPDVEKVLEAALSRGFIDGELINETGLGEPHWHMTINRVTEKGMEYLKTPNPNSPKQSNREQ